MANKSNGSSSHWKLLTNSNISCFQMSNSFKSEVYESLLLHDDPGLVFVNPDATYNDTATWFSNLVYTLNSNSNLE